MKKRCLAALLLALVLLCSCAAQEEKSVLSDWQDSIQGELTLKEGDAWTLIVTSCKVEGLSDRLNVAEVRIQYRKGLAPFLYAGPIGLQPGEMEDLFFQVYTAELCCRACPGCFQWEVSTPPDFQTLDGTWYRGVPKTNKYQIKINLVEDTNPKQYTVTVRQLANQP